MFVMTYRYRIYPDAQQEQLMLDWLETCRRVYNFALAERKDWIASRKCQLDRCSLQREYVIPADVPYPGYYVQKKALTAAKQGNDWLQAVHSQVLQEVVARVDGAFAFMRERGYGFPRFKKVGQVRTLSFPQLGKRFWQGERVSIPKVGVMPVVVHRPIPDGFVIKSAKVLRKHSGWYVLLCLVVDVDIPQVPARSHSLGIDVGLEYFLSTSDGGQVERPRFFNKLHRQLELLQRRLKRKQKRSRNRAKLIQKIGRIHERIAAARRDWHHKVAHRLCDRAETLFVEDLDFRTMAKGMPGKHALDAGLGQFLNQVLPWVCFKRGVYYGKVDPRGTSQTCPDCGARVRKDLSVRVHECHECGSTKPRDVAAAQVIDARGLSGVEMVCGAEVAGVWETISSQLAVKQKTLEATQEARALSAG